MSCRGTLPQGRAAPFTLPAPFRPKRAGEAKSSLKTGSWDFRGPTEPTPWHITQLGRRCRIGGHASRPGTFRSPLLDTSSAPERPTLPPQAFYPFQTPRAADILSDSEEAPDLDPSRSKRPTTDLPVVSRCAGSLGPVARSGHLTQ